MTTVADPRISRLGVPSEQDLPDNVRALFENTRRREGHLPNWLPAFALDPAHFERLIAFLFPLLEGSPDVATSLTSRERTILSTIVSVENGCAYCHTLHVHELGEFLSDHWLANRIALGHKEVEELSEREHALADLAIALTHHPREVSDDDLVRLRSLGLTDVDIYEAVQVIAALNATNRISLALGLLPDRGLFEGHEGKERH